MSEVIALNRPMQSDMAHVTESYEQVPKTLHDLRARSFNELIDHSTPRFFVSSVEWY